MKVKELVLGDDGQWSGVYANSLVSAPAIERNFIYMSKQKPRNVVMQTDAGERRMVYGPVMIPDLMIYRKDDATGEEYYATYTSETVQKCQQNYLKKGLQSATTIEHAFPVMGVTMVESWLIEDSAKDKSAALGFEALPKGTWMAGYHIEDDGLWDMVKSGAINGFSVEAWFDHVEKQSATNDDERFFNELKGLLEKICG